MTRLRAFVILSFAIAAVGGDAFQRAAPTSSYMYVAVGNRYAGGPAIPPEIRVYDAVTSEIVTSIPLAGDPWGMAFSPDGRRLYVSVGGGADGVDGLLSTIDATTHQLLSTDAVGREVIADAFCGVNASASGMFPDRDGRRLYIHHCPPAAAFRDSFGVFDTSSRALLTVVGSGIDHPNTLRAIASHSAANRLYITYDEYQGPSAGSRRKLRELDLGSLAEIATTDLGAGSIFGVHVSPDGRYLYATLWYDGPAASTYTVRTLDAATKQLLSTVLQESWPVLYVALGPSGTRLYASQFDRPFVDVVDPASTARLRRLAVPVPSRFTATEDERHLYVLHADNNGSHPRLAILDTNTGVTVRSAGPAPFRSVASTPVGAPRCSYRVASKYVSLPHTGGAGGVAITTPCAWQATTDATWLRPNTSNGVGTSAVAFTADPNYQGASRTATLVVGGQPVTVTQAGIAQQPPFGVVETPVNQAFGLSGSIGVTGWALDDVGVSRVRLYRDAVAGEPAALIYLGDANLVEGSRPDVQAAFPSAPFANRAGWGLMVLTNMLPNGGNGTFRLSAFAEDVEGQTTFLGATTFTAANTTASLPFGALDTPGQGETVSGTILNWGWALSPGATSIPVDGSTINVFVDGVPVGRLTQYGLPRADIDALFPNYTNTGKAVGYFRLDTRTLANGVHTIAWSVTNSLGQTQGIGSRYFAVSNP